MLEGAQVPFLVWIDHKDLEYIRMARRLNARQARWTLFFSQFNFNLLYRPGSQNTKLDTLSRMDESEKEAEVTEAPILPTSHLVVSLSWEIENKVTQAMQEGECPSACLPDQHYVLERLRSEVLQWAHNSKLVCHPVMC